MKGPLSLALSLSLSWCLFWPVWEVGVPLGTKRGTVLKLIMRCLPPKKHAQNQRIGTLSPDFRGGTCPVAFRVVYKRGGL